MNKQARLQLDTDRAAGVKLCFVCQTRKPFDQFSKDKSRSDGMQPRCKACYAEYRIAKASDIKKRKAGLAPTVEERYPGGVQACDCCQVTKPLSAFKPFKIPANTFRATCDDCYAQQRLEWAAKERARKAQWAKENPDYVKPYQKQWVEQNPDRVRAKQKKSYQKHRDERRAGGRARYAANAELYRFIDRLKRVLGPEKRRYKHRKYYAENRDKELVRHRLRKTKLKGVQGHHTVDDIRALMTQQNGLCAHSWCRKPLGEGYHVDHKMPLSLGGTNWPSNLQLLCPYCNMSKGGKHPVKYYANYGVDFPTSA